MVAPPLITNATNNITGVYTIFQYVQEVSTSFFPLILFAMFVILFVIFRGASNSNSKPFAVASFFTMVMSILERTREIGIMKAIGGSEKEIKLIFFVEAGFIGTLGAIFGLILGWLVTRIANQIVNAKLIPQDELPVDLFYFPLWLLLGATAFSILISLAAGLYPAIRAARIDPVKALRHD